MIKHTLKPRNMREIQMEIQSNRFSLRRKRSDMARATITEEQVLYSCQETYL